jgi:hypothetical protein
MPSLTWCGFGMAFKELELFFGNYGMVIFLLMMKDIGETRLTMHLAFIVGIKTKQSCIFFVIVSRLGIFMIISLMRNTWQDFQVFGLYD